MTIITESSSLESFFLNRLNAADGVRAASIGGTRLPPQVIEYLAALMHSWGYLALDTEQGGGRDGIVERLWAIETVESEVEKIGLLVSLAEETILVGGLQSRSRRVKRVGEDFYTAVGANSLERAGMLCRSQSLKQRYFLQSRMFPEMMETVRGLSDGLPK